MSIIFRAPSYKTDGKEEVEEEEEAEEEAEQLLLSSKLILLPDKNFRQHNLASSLALWAEAVGDGLKGVL